MKFALYHPWVYLRGGAERFVLELVNSSRHDWTIWTHHFGAETTFPEFGDLDVRELTPGISVRRSIGPLMGAARAISRTEIPDGAAQGLLVSSEGFGDLVVNRTNLPAAAYCHTPLKILHDPIARAALSENKPQQAAALRMLGPAFHSVDRRMWRKFRHVFVNSEETRRRVEAAGLVPSGPIDVVHPGVDVRRFHTSGAPRERFLLVAGRIMWQKNIDLAIDALRELDGRGVRAKLIVAGTVDDKSRPYLAALQAKAHGLDVEFRLNPSDEDLTRLYSRCAALVYTPANEDFGIVPLEAMACGAPVLAVDSGGPRETVVHGETGWLLPNDATAFAAIARRVLADPEEHREIRRAARRRAEEFRWDAVAARIDDVMEQIAVEPATVPVPVAVPAQPVSLSGLMSTPVGADATAVVEP
jgi:glycosyltransferase involved in cell wall biosynthesis